MVKKQSKVYEFLKEFIWPTKWKVIITALFIFSVLLGFIGAPIFSTTIKGRDFITYQPNKLLLFFVLDYLGKFLQLNSWLLSILILLAYYYLIACTIILTYSLVIIFIKK